jgi:hypothetical protein
MLGGNERKKEKNRSWQTIGRRLPAHEEKRKGEKTVD